MYPLMQTWLQQKSFQKISVTFSIDHFFLCQITRQEPALCPSHYVYMHAAELCLCACMYYVKVILCLQSLLQFAVICNLHVTNSHLDLSYIYPKVGAKVHNCVYSAYIISFLHNDCASVLVCVHVHISQSVCPHVH